MNNDLVPPNIQRLVPYQPGKPIEELERELGVTNAIKLASNENPFGPSPIAVEAMKKAVEKAHFYPDAGTYALRRAIAEYHSAEYHQIGMDQVVPGCGSNEIIDLICRTYAGPEDHAVIGVPSFVCYHLGLTTANIPFTAVPLREKIFWETEALADAVRPNTKILFLANPNNPTGTHVGKAALVKLLRELPERIMVVVDEAYVEFADAPDFESAFSMWDLRERMLILRTFSKAFGLAALRVGYGVGRPEVVEYLNRSRPPFNVCQIGQIGAIAALTDLDYVARYVKHNAAERIRVGRALTELGLRIAPSQTNFHFVELDRPGRGVYEIMLRRGVIVRPLPAPIESWLRITIGTVEENDRMLTTLASVLKEGAPKDGAGAPR